MVSHMYDRTLNVNNNDSLEAQSDASICYNNCTTDGACMHVRMHICMDAGRRTDGLICMLMKGHAGW